MTLISTRCIAASSPDRVGIRRPRGVADQPEPLSQISRNSCKSSAEVVLQIRWRRNDKHHPEHDISSWAPRDSNPARRIKRTKALCAVLTSVFAGHG
jgi:hypothetical protein